MQKIYVIINIVPERFHQTINPGYYTGQRTEQNDVILDDDKGILLATEEDECWSEFFPQS